jgi:hypothetical protein
VAATGAAQAASVQRTADGGYTLFGASYNYNIYTHKNFLIKTNDQGQALWAVPFSAEGWNVLDTKLLTLTGNAMQTADGGYIASFIDYRSDMGHLAKVDGSGSSVQWNNPYGQSYDPLYNVQPTADGGSIAAGYTQSMGAGNRDGWLLKVDGNGQQQWGTPYGYSSHDELYAVRPTADGGYIAAGITNDHPSGPGYDDGWLVKVNAGGKRSWDIPFGGANYDSFVDVQQTADGGYIAAGTTSSTGNTNGSGWLVKTNGQGKQQWSKSFTAGPILASVQQTADGGYIACGYSDTLPEGNGGNDFWLLKLDGKGNVQWQNAYGGSGDDWASSAQQTPDGGYVVYGQSDTYRGTMLVKVNADGSQAWGMYYPY